MNPPPWFQRAMAECESLSLDVASDRRKLWAAIADCLPAEEIRYAIESRIEPEHPLSGAVFHAVMGVLK